MRKIIKGNGETKVKWETSKAIYKVRVCVRERDTERRRETERQEIR